jgi:chromodomain-helicase-DNA-binding protein 7
VQVVATINHLITVQQQRGPYLVVAPLSTIQHWRREFESWTQATVCLYHDTGAGV